MVTSYSSSLEMHRIHKGKMETVSKVPLENSVDLSLAYSPGVAEPCIEIANDPSLVFDYTIKGNLVAVITDGTAVLGLGDIGPEAALPVMEGKALLLKRYADIDSFPICLNTKNVDEIVATIKTISPTFGGINLEDISAPRCFEVEKRLREELDIPVFHDDQHGTAIVVAAGLINALKVVGKNKESVKIVINGAGAAGIAITKLLHHIGFNHIIVCDSKGSIFKDRQFSMNPIKHEVAEFTNPLQINGDLKTAMTDADIFIGVSVANILTQEHIDGMKNDPIVFALANPSPELSPENAKKFGVRIIATGRSDYPNQVNNVLAFPGIFRGALDVRASEINESMKLAATYAIAGLIEESQLNDNCIIPDPFDARIAPLVAQAVAAAAIESGVSKLTQPQLQTP